MRGRGKRGKNKFERFYDVKKFLDENNNKSYIVDDLCSVFSVVNCTMRRWVHLLFEEGLIDVKTDKGHFVCRSLNYFAVHSMKTFEKYVGEVAKPRTHHLTREYHPDVGMINNLRRIESERKITESPIFGE